MAKKEEARLNGLSRLAAIRQEADQGQTPCDEEFERLYPHLFSLLTNNRVAEGKMVEMPRLGIVNNAGDWVLSLAVAGLQMYGSIMAKTLNSGLAAIDQALAGGTFPWIVKLTKPPRIREMVKPLKSG